MSKFKNKAVCYPRLAQFGIEVVQDERGYSYIDPIKMEIALLRAGIDYRKVYRSLEGQTMLAIGGQGCPYPWDVEPILERLVSGKLTGTQLVWD